jgi:hypothetical protein
VFLKIRNDAPTRRVFHYDGCDLDLSNDHVPTGLIINSGGIVRQIETTEPYEGGEQNSRWLIFSYPEGKYPTRLECGRVTIEFPPLGPEASKGK